MRKVQGNVLKDDSRIQCNGQIGKMVRFAFSKALQDFSRHNSEDSEDSLKNRTSSLNIQGEISSCRL